VPLGAVKARSFRAGASVSYNNCLAKLSAHGCLGLRETVFDRPCILSNLVDMPGSLGESQDQTRGGSKPASSCHALMLKDQTALNNILDRKQGKEVHCRSELNSKPFLMIRNIGAPEQ
jgi:hypothetical protein